MLTRKTWGVAFIITGVPCMSNGYQFVRQEYMVSFGWGLGLVGIALTIFGIYLYSGEAAEQRRQAPERPVRSAKKQGKKKARK